MSGTSESRRFLGSLLVAVGLLIAVLSGLCTLGYAASELATPSRLPNGAANLFAGPEMVAPILIVGALPFALGAALVFLGRALIKRSKGAPPQAAGEQSQGEREG